MPEWATQCLAAGTLITALSALVLWRRFQTDRLLNASGGLHFNVLLCVGVGLVIYAVSPYPYERVPKIVDALPVFGWNFLLAYSLVVIAEYRLPRRRSKTDVQILSWMPRINTRGVIAAYAVALIGYWGSTYDFASIGLGTIFPVIKLLWYPTIMVSIAISGRDGYHFLVALVGVSASLVLAVISGWRSELILLLGAVLLGMALRNPRFVKWNALAMVMAFLLVLPFVNLKKTDYQKFSMDPWGTFTETLGMSLLERLDQAGQFWTNRVNFAREAAYVEEALEVGRVELRGGETYVEAILQLIPRTLWETKPSFNSTTNYLLPRQIGLLDPNDPVTSWGINIYAEAIWNFGRLALWWFVPAFFAFAALLDQGVQRIVQVPQVRWFAGSGLFFYMMGIVGLVMGLTYVWWLLFFSYLVDVGLRKQPDYAPVPGR